MSTGIGNGLWISWMVSVRTESEQATQAANDGANSKTVTSTGTQMPPSVAQAAPAHQASGPVAQAL